jgi:type IV pilus assembly protein PilE
MKKHFSIKAFTIMEILIVVIIVGIIAAFAIPNYGKSVDQSHTQDAIIQLSAIRTANQLYYARTSKFWPAVAGTKDVSAINTALSLNIIENAMTYTCDVPGALGTTFVCTATPASGGTNITVNQNALSTTNPGCPSGNQCTF